MNARDELVNTAQDMLARAQSGTVALADAVTVLAASDYTDPEMFEREKRLLFRRVPLMLAATCELPQPGDYKAMDVAGVPVLIMRGKDGVARAFLNGCTHRGARLAEGCGHASRLTCPYHAWSFGTDGRLLAIAARDLFGEPDHADLGLIGFPTQERAGLIWAILDPAATSAGFDAFLHGIDAQLEGFGFAGWSHFRSQAMFGANWKLAFDAHLEFYHLPVLHRNTFGPQMSNLAQYYAIGPHQRLGLVSRDEHMLGQDAVGHLADLPQEEWPMQTLLFGEWIVFPNVSINCFYKGGRGAIISQVLPGPRVDESTTVQIFLHEHAPAEDARAEAAEMADFLGNVVGTEDLPMSRGQQSVLQSGLMDHVLIGRNEGGVAHFHHWVRHFASAPQDADLATLMQG